MRNFVAYSIILWKNVVVDHVEITENGSYLIHNADFKSATRPILATGYMRGEKHKK